MKPYTISIASETALDNKDKYLRLIVTGSSELKAVFQSYVSSAYPSMVFEYLNPSNHGEENWFIRVPGGMRINAQELAEEISGHFLRASYDKDFEVEFEYSPNIAPIL